MKARVKTTGQTIDVVSIGRISVTKSIQEFKSKDGDIFNENEIEFDDTIDWEQRRYEIAKDLYVKYDTMDVIDCVASADELIKTLKGE